MSNLKNEFLNVKYDYSCSSWNYGNYSINNPYYYRNFSQKNILESKSNYNNGKNYNKNLNKSNSQYNIYGKRILKPEEKIVTDDILKCQNNLKIFQNKINKQKKIYRNKSANLNRKLSNNSNNTNNIYNNNSNISEIKSNLSNYKYKLNFYEWKAVKDKQLMIFNKIKKIKENEDVKMEKINKKVDKYYDEIKKEKRKEWLKRKNAERRMEKEKKLLLLKQKEEEKNRKIEENTESSLAFFQQ